jgi:hypothetical protein
VSLGALLRSVQPSPQQAVLRLLEQRTPPFAPRAARAGHRAAALTEGTGSGPHKPNRSIVHRSSVVACGAHSCWTALFQWPRLLCLGGGNRKIGPAHQRATHAGKKKIGHKFNQSKDNMLRYTLVRFSVIFPLCSRRCLCPKFSLFGSKCEANLRAQQKNRAEQSAANAPAERRGKGEERGMRLLATCHVHCGCAVTGPPRWRRGEGSARAVGG